MNSNHKFPRHYHDLNHAGLLAWAGLAAELDGADWYRPVGNIELATSEEGRAELTDRVNRLTEWGYDARLIDPAEAQDIEPALRFPSNEIAAAWFPAEGYLLTEPLIDRLVAQARKHGAELLTGEEGRVIGLETAPGAASLVSTAADAVRTADEVIFCAGRWTPGLAAMIGAESQVPLVAFQTPGATAPGLVVRVGPASPAEAPVRVLHTPEVCLRPHPGGLLHLENPDEAVDLHTPESELRRLSAELLRRAQRAVRGLDDARVVEYKVCVRPMPLDGHPIIGRLPATPAVYIAVTHSGVTLAAHLAKLITADLTTPTPPAVLAPYGPARFLETSAGT